MYRAFLGQRFSPIVVAGLVGALAAFVLVISPALSFGVVLTCALAAALLFVPVEYLPAAVVVGVVAVPPLLIESGGGGAIRLSPLGGQGRFLLVIAAFVAIRVLLVPQRVALPGFLRGAI